MTTSRRPDGTYEGLWRRKGMKPLHLSLRTDRKSVARDRHDAVQTVVRAGRYPLIEQLRAGVVKIEQVTAMVASGEALNPVELPPVDEVASVDVGSEHASEWETVDATCAKYVAWVKAHPRKAEGTAANAAFQTARFRNFEYQGERIGDLPLDRVPAAAILAYQQSFIDAAISPNSITVYMSRPGALWRWAQGQEERDAREARRPARMLHSPVDSSMLYRETRHRDRVLTVDEVERLFTRTPEPLRFPVGCGMLGGLRVGEMLHLRPSLDVDLEFGTIAIREKLVGGRRKKWKPKTRRSRRVVPMSDELRAMAEVHAAKYASDAWMLPSPALAGLPMTEDGFRVQFQQIVEGAGLVYGRDDPQGVTYHTLRHSFASHAVMRGVDLYTVAKLLGDSVKIVEDVYADLSPDFKRTAVAKLAGAFALPKITQSDTTSDTGAVQNVG